MLIHVSIYFVYQYPKIDIPLSIENNLTCLILVNDDLRKMLKNIKLEKTLVLHHGLLKSLSSSQEHTNDRAHPISSLGVDMGGVGIVSLFCRFENVNNGKVILRWNFRTANPTCLHLSTHIYTSMYINTYT